jgi:Transposase DDE domain
VRGYDAGKKIRGRKRHILVDTLGLLLLVMVTAANVQDRNGAYSHLWQNSSGACACSGPMVPMPARWKQDPVFSRAERKNAVATAASRCSRKQDFRDLSVFVDGTVDVPQRPATLKSVLSTLVLANSDLIDTLRFIGPPSIPIRPSPLGIISDSVVWGSRP